MCHQIGAYGRGQTTMKCRELAWRLAGRIRFMPKFARAFMRRRANNASLLGGRDAVLLRFALAREMRPGILANDEWCTASFHIG